LTDRLQRLVAAEVFRRVQYQSGPDRYEYLFTEKGKELFGPMLAMLRWGDKWLADGKPPLILTHTDCGKDFKPTVACNQCTTALVAKEMRYVMNYRDPMSGGA
jgi:DNA-binding HxlR family transcriptional regulator